MNVNEMLAERKDRYGSFDTHSFISHSIKEALRINGNMRSFPPNVIEALDMIAHKMARISNGDPFYLDNWVDIAGYAAILEEINSPTYVESAKPF